MTAPDTVIWSAILASAAVPGILNPVVLMQKLKDGSIVPWSWGSRFKDGSLRVDIPVQALNQYFNVTHPLVSQVNPHVHLFFFASRGSAGKPVAHRKGKGWRGNFLLSAAEQWLKHELTKNFKVIRDLELLPQLLGQDWSSVFLQRFDGAVTIWPRTRLWDWFRILTDPDPNELERMIRVGQSVTWPKLHMVENRVRIEKQILLGRQVVHRVLKNKSRNDPRQFLLQRTVQNPDFAAASQPSMYPSGSRSGSDSVPLSVDTDAEAAFARASTYYRRGQVSKDTSPTRHSDKDARRRKWPSAGAGPTNDEDNVEDTVLDTVPPSRKPAGTEQPGFFSRFRDNSISKLGLPSSFSFEHGSSRLDSSPDNRLEAHWSSESSSDDDFPLNGENEAS